MISVLENLGALLGDKGAGQAGEGWHHLPRRRVSCGMAGRDGNLAGTGAVSALCCSRQARICGHQHFEIFSFVIKLVMLYTGRFFANYS